MTCQLPDRRTLAFRPVTGDDRLVAWLWAVSAAAVATAGALHPLGTSRLPPCLFRSLAGIPCPTCGTTRGVDALRHGDVLSAVEFNPLMTLALCAFVLGGLIAPLWIHMRRTAPVLSHPLPPEWRWGMAAAFLANWALVIGLSR